MEASVLFLLVGVLILAIVLVVYISFSRKESPGLNKEKFQSRWLEIENSISRNNLPACQLAVLNADKLLDQALKDRRFNGETMGERMKAANATWSNANDVWSAHKVRNQLAHEHDATLSFDATLRMLGAFKQALKDLGAI